MSISAKLLSTATAWIVAGASLLQPGQAARLESRLVDRLHQALNDNDTAELMALIGSEGTVDPQQLTARLERLTDSFGPLTWQVSQSQPLPDGRARLDLSVRGTGEVAGVVYQLEATQTLAVSSHQGQILSQEVLQEESWVYSGDQRLPVTLQIPDAVLTGQRYDVDVILDDPLDSGLLAGGILEVSPDEVEIMGAPTIQLGTLNAGGLFKRVQAPYTAGGQTWTIMLVHPDGTLIASKRVQVRDTPPLATPPDFP
ncbi:MAG: hypothetical protein F4Z75_00480 [Synechococcus sp. SB0668_bin_15]|nr:hypothetical protein [Synechococcus sp. SB0668_bin_15]MYA90387.1 hypothetical protein [Synechococcus sp. SB0663_bin_10]MYC50289.1 hypothetical protein [Synechococcus sp. SB0662_bin_14]MYG47593.1 hypothetical protein [Synechococcus sp. SB0675_bin_6]MYJ60627.1 hypothetical protein [Synechococcus sp. SB0672_bin_6]MYK90955.1 hypothetical protein [Synechococcus sp. SB0669_bin_8]